jgi:hypothetical protein
LFFAFSTVAGLGLARVPMRGVNRCYKDLDF